MTTLLHEMERRNAQFGLETMCVGGGQGNGRCLRTRVDPGFNHRSAGTFPPP